MKTLLLTLAASAVIPSAPFEDHTGPYGAGITVGSNHVEFAMISSLCVALLRSLSN
jgi:hypothetical protein